MVMDYLFELGHRRIAFAGNTLDSLLVVNRLEAYHRGLEQQRIPSDQRLVKLHEAWSLSPEQMTDFCRRSLDELLTLEKPPTTIVCATDSLALEFIQAARMRRLRIPESLSITGYGDMYYAAFMDPSLTTVRVDQRATGEAAAMQLLQQIEGATHVSQTLIRPTFVERRSCAMVKAVISIPP
jgi:DNA-binding LacI/PurR family transcriptional regulator